MVISMRVSRSLLVLATAAICFGVVATSSAQASLGATFTGPAGSSGGLNDVAYDDAHDVYLHVYGGNRIFGQFVNGGGAPVGGRFPITGGPFTFGNWLHVEYSTAGPSDVFFVAFAAEYGGNRGKNIFGQLVRFNGGGGDLIGGAFAVSALGVNASVAQASGGIAFSSAAQRFLVTWEDARGRWDVFARLFNVDGSPASDEMNLTANGGIGEGQPNVAYDWHRNRFLVVYRAWQELGPAERTGAYCLLLDGTTAQPLGGRITLNEGFYVFDSPGVVFLPESSSYLTYWMEERSSGSADIVARIVDGNGAPAGDVYGALTPGWNGSPDGDYNWGSRTVMLAGMHGSGFVWSGLLSGTGVPLSSFQGSTVGFRNGTWNPRVAAGGSAQYGVGFIVDYSAAWVERWQISPAGSPGPRRGVITPPPPPPPPPPPTGVIDIAGAPNGSWFFAEGVAASSGLGFDTTYVLSNEWAEALTVRGYFARDDGQVFEKYFNIAPLSRLTVSLRDQIGTGAYGAVIQSMTPGRQVFAGLTVTWGPGAYGASSEVATGNYSRTWYFAEGSRNFEFFQNFFMVFNPGLADANVRFTFFKPDGTTPTFSAVVKAQSRYTLWANALPALAWSDFAVRIDADREVVAERSMYWGREFEGGHSSQGAPALSASWYFAEGAAAPGFETYYTLLNPHDVDVWVDATYYFDASLGLPPRVISYLVPKRSRYTVQLNSQLGNVGGVSVLFKGRDWIPIMAERSIYWGFSQFGVDGTNVVGAVGPAMAWRLPEGSFQAGLDNFVLVANPNPFDVIADIVIYVEGGGRYTAKPRRVIPAGSRVTVFMRHDFTTDQADLSALLAAGARYTVKVESKTLGGPIFVEHATYWGWTGTDYWRAGSAAFGIPQ